MAPAMKKPAAGGETARSPIARGELADAFVQELIHALESVDADGRRSVRAEFAARLAAMLIKNDENPK